MSTTTEPSPAVATKPDARRYLLAHSAVYVLPGGEAFVEHHGQLGRNDVDRVTVDAATERALQRVAAVARYIPVDRLPAFCDTEAPDE